MRFVLAQSATVLLACLGESQACGVQAARPEPLASTKYDIGSPSSEGLILGSNFSLTLKSSTAKPDIIVLDYGANVEGIPTFEVKSASGDTSGLEITYSESKGVLDGFYMSDGPNGLSAAMDTYRVNRYNITGPSTYTNRLIQGGFRYQKLNLSTAGELVLANVGVRPTTSTTPLTRLPGVFESSDDDLNRIWKVGARSIQLNEIPAKSIPPFWKVTSEGSLVESLAPQVFYSITATALTQYRIAFEVKPVSNGFGFSVLADTLNSGIYIFCDINNGSISAHHGTTEMDSAPLAFALLPANLSLGEWATVTATVAMTNISISINGAPILDFSQSASFYGSFGLGASLGHSAVFRNLSATTLTGEKIYSSNLTDESFLADFLIGTNPLDTIVDGSKRDRITYAGDLDVASGSSLASTNGVSYIKGTLELLGSFQLKPGFFVPNAKIQQAPFPTTIDANITGLIGYSFNLLTAASQFYLRTGNTSFAQEWAPKAVRMLDWAHSQVLPGNGLLNISNIAFGGDWNQFDPAQGGVVTKFNTVYAYALQECITLLTDGGVDPAPYISQLDALRTAINTHLWSDRLNAYQVSESVKEGFAQDANGLAILAGVTGLNHSSSKVLTTLDQLSTPKGPLAFSNGTDPTSFSRLISPYASAYHLRAALSAGDSHRAIGLLKTLWAPMADPKNENYTGCFWEALETTGAPRSDKSTSLCHAWSAGPTGDLSEYVLGIKAVKPAYREWKVAPITLGLDWAKGKIAVPGGEIAVNWNASSGVLSRLEVDSPVGTTGTVVVPQNQTGEYIGGFFHINGQAVDAGNGSFSVVGGEPFVLTYTGA